MRSSFVASVVAACLVVLPGCSCESGHSAIEEQNMAVVRSAHAALQRGDLEAFASHIDPNYVRHCQAMPPGQQKLEGTEEFFAFLQEWVTAVPEYEDTISPMIADGDKVAYVSTMTGVQTGPMGGFPATGKEFTLVNIVIHRLENGKVVESWVSWDNVAFLSQLDLMPTMEGPPEVE
jgi:steroid delta-isomerase-like uncharacterized protein